MCLCVCVHLHFCMDLCVAGVGVLASSFPSPPEVSGASLNPLISRSRWAALLCGGHPETRVLGAVPGEDDHLPAACGLEGAGTVAEARRRRSAAGFSYGNVK